MRTRVYIIIAAVLLLFSGTGTVCAQETIESLNAVILRLEKEINLNQDLLVKVRNDRSVNFNQLKLISSRIENRREIINTLDTQISLLNKNITSKRANIEKLDKQLSGLRDDYAAMIRSAYNNYKLNTSLAFIFSAADFNDATRRVNYMRRYNEMREKKALEINTLKETFDAELKRLTVDLERLEEAKISRDAELAELSEDSKSYQASILKLEGQESSLQRKIKEQEAQKKKAQEQLSRIISEENRKAAAKRMTAAEEEAFVALSGRFDENQGSLPYPVRGGVIIDRFGTHKHPTQKNLEVTNKGVNIAGVPGQTVNCVFEGEVTGVSYINGLQYCVLVRHGEYLTVYSNLESVAVKIKDKVIINQKIGTLTRDNGADNCYLHFELWQGKTYLDPEQWLKR